MPRTPNDQVELLPDEPLQTELRQIQTRLLDYTITQAPEQEFMESVRRTGVLVPILVRPYRNRFRVIAGRRRAMAAITAGHETIPALVVNAVANAGPSTVSQASLSITENAHRAPNPIGDMLAIEMMINAGAGPQQIADELGLSLSLVRQRMRLAGLVEPLREAVRDGNLSIHLAERVSRLTDERQFEFLRHVVGQTVSQETTPTLDRRITSNDIRSFLGEELRRGATGRFSEETEEMFPPASMGAASVVGQGIANGQAYDIILWRNEQWVPLNLAANHLIERIQHQGWGGVLALLTEIDRIMPVEPNDDSDAFFSAMEEMRDRVARRLAATPSAPLAT